VCLKKYHTIVPTKYSAVRQSILTPFDWDNAMRIINENLVAEESFDQINLDVSEITWDI
jgi:hypothetical protein